MGAQVVRSQDLGHVTEPTEAQRSQARLPATVPQIPQEEVSVEEEVEEDFLVHLPMDRQRKLGLVVNIMLESGLLCVTKVQEDGQVAAWNALQPEQKRVCRGDWIVEVNGVRGTAATLFSQLHRSGPLNMYFSRQRPANIEEQGEQSYDGQSGDDPATSCRIPITVQTCTAEQRFLGIEGAVSKDGYVIKKIGAGVIQDWNDEHPELEVREGDTVVFVNGVQSSDMLATLWRPGLLRIVLRRGPRPATPEVLPEACVACLPTVEVPQRHCNGEREDECCPVCLEALEPGTRALELPCRHHFHKECIVPWLTKHSVTCPLCLWAADHPGGEAAECLHGVASEVAPQSVPSFLAGGASRSVPRGASVRARRSSASL